MAVLSQLITDQFAAYNGDSAEVMAEMPDETIPFSIYSPPFGSEDGALYKYSSDERDLSNCADYPEFLDHYAIFVEELHRLTWKGRSTAVHCTDTPMGNSGKDHLHDLPGDIIRLHESKGWLYTGRRTIWKEPLWVRNRTLGKNLAHKTIVEDSAYAGVASADYLLTFRKRGANPVPIVHPTGLQRYAGECPLPPECLKFKNWPGKQTENRYSQYIWRRYASSIWDDIRMGRVLPFEDCKEPDDEKHVHPLQRDIVERAVVLWTNPGETVLTPFMGVGTEVYESVRNGRRGMGIELKTAYYRQALANLAKVNDPEDEYGEGFDFGNWEETEMAS